MLATLPHPEHSSSSAQGGDKSCPEKTNSPGNRHPDPVIWRFPKKDGSPFKNSHEMV